MTADRRVGIVLPSREQEMRRGRGGRQLQSLVDLAGAADVAGIDDVWVGESPLARPRAEPFTLLGAVAARTDAIGLGTAALIPALRHPLHTAHAIATLDQLAPGRLTVAVGAGFPYAASADEFAAFGVPFSARHRRLDRIVAQWRSIWSGDESAAAIPEPTTPGGPPIWLAAGPSPANAGRLGRLYDGWLPYVPSAEAYAAGRDAIAPDAPADRAVALGLYVTLTLGPSSQASSTQEQYLQEYYGVGAAAVTALQACYAGEPEGAIDFLRPFVDAGVGHVVIRLGSLDPEPQLRLLTDEVVPAIREQAGR